MTGGCAHCGVSGKTTRSTTRGWLYKTVPPAPPMRRQDARQRNTAAMNVGTVPDTTVVNPGSRRHHVSFYQDTVRETKQTAAFASLDYDLLPQGAHHHRRHTLFPLPELLQGKRNVDLRLLRSRCPAGGCQSASATTWIQKGSRTPNRIASSRANLTWHIAPDHMVYYTFSQGFRPGGFNQNGGFFAYAPARTASRSTEVPAPYSPGQAREQRDRLEDRVVGSSAAMERRVLSREMDQRAGRILRSGRHRQRVLRHQRSGLPDQGRRDAAGRACLHGPHAAGRGLLEPK